MTTAYRKRNFYDLGAWTIAGHTLKVYGISTDEAGRLRATLVDAARSYAEHILPSAADAEGGAERLGYCVLHGGTLGTWLLVHWWAHEDICCHRLALAAPGTSSFEAMDRRPLLACVWEHIVMHHERDAWVRHMMSETPDPAAYRRDRLPDGRY